MSSRHRLASPIREIAMPVDRLGVDGDGADALTWAAIGTSAPSTRRQPPFSGCQFVTRRTLDTDEC
jgi:hypothetical protein